MIRRNKIDLIFDSYYWWLCSKVKHFAPTFKECKNCYRKNKLKCNKFVIFCNFLSYPTNCNCTLVSPITSLILHCKWPLYFTSAARMQSRLQFAKSHIWYLKCQFRVECLVNWLQLALTMGFFLVHEGFSIISLPGKLINFINKSTINVNDADLFDSNYLWIVSLIDKRDNQTNKMSGEVCYNICTR